MTPADFRATLAALGLSQVEGGRILGVSDRTMRSWAAGDRHVPEPVAKLLRLMAAGKIRPRQVADA